VFASLNRCARSLGLLLQQSVGTHDAQSTIMLRYVTISSKMRDFSIAVGELLATGLKLRSVLGRLSLELVHSGRQSGDDVVFGHDAHVGVQTESGQVTDQLI